MFLAAPRGGWIRSVLDLKGAVQRTVSFLSPSLIPHVLGIPKDIDVAASGEEH